VGEIVLLRHGETEWSRAGRHTGLTDIDLTPTGEQQAVAAGRLVARRQFVLVLISPLVRARRTAELAGLAARAQDGVDVDVDPDLVEWDYGGYEGMTSDQIQAAGHPGWAIFRDGVVPGATPGEALQEVAARGARVLARIGSALAGGDVALVGHGHALRVLATVWLGREPHLAAQLVLAAASVSVLGAEHGSNAITGWNRPG
jgi:broad specificity phosphatase PhoE